LKGNDKNSQINESTFENIKDNNKHANQDTNHIIISNNHLEHNENILHNHLNDGEDFHKNASHNLSVALILNLLFNVVVIGGGILTNSVAILADALHDLSDTFSIVVAWLLEHVSQKEGNDNFSYGYKRFSIFGALITSTVVILGSLGVIHEAFTRLFVAESLDASGMVIIAILGIIFKGGSLIKLHSGKTFNEKAISIHMFGDVFQWIALLIISLILVFVDAPILDPIASIVVSIWVIYNLAKTFIASTKILLQANPSDININDLKVDLMLIDHVSGIDELHTWSLDGLENVLTAKVKVSAQDEEEMNDTKEKLEEVANEYNIKDTTFEFIKDDD